MGIYRTLLEEEITHLDDNKDSAGQIDELVSDIEDQVVNSDEVQEAKDAEFGTEYGPDAPVNEMYEAIAESDRAWNEMVHQIGLNELSAMVSGRTVLYESFEDIKNWFKNIKDKIVAFFKKVWQVIQRWIHNLVAMVTPGKKFAEKYGSQIRDGYKLYADADKHLKGYPFSDEDDKMGEDPSDSITGDAKTFTTDPEAAVNRHFAADKYEEMKDAIAQAIFGTTDSSEYRTSMMNRIRGAEEPEELDTGMPPDVIIETLKGKKKAMQEGKKAFDKSKSDFKKILQKLDSLERKAAKKNSSTKTHRDGDGGTEDELAEVMRAVSFVRSIQSMIQIARSVSFSCLRQFYAQCRRFGNYYVQLANKGKYKGFQKESASYGFSSSLNLV